MNEKIPHKTLLVINEKGERMPNISLKAALKLFDVKKANLVLVHDGEKPVAKIIPKETKTEVKEKQSTKSGAIQSTKELEVRSCISSHDLGVKLKKGTDMLGKNHRLKLTIIRRKAENKEFPTMQSIESKVVSTIEAVGKLVNKKEERNRVTLQFDPKPKTQDGA